MSLLYPMKSFDSESTRVIAMHHFFSPKSREQLKLNFVVNRNAEQV